ncbi:MAG TPA: EAL domain-containing protein [Chloroflexota bacterium]|nr:EAL domain-containing protein [Chloroflexota bacterium]
MTALAPKQLAYLRGRKGQPDAIDHEALFRTTFNQIPIGLSHTRPIDGAWLRMNDALCDMLGYTRSELNQLTWRDVTHPDDIAQDAAEYERILAGEIGSYKLIKRYLHKDGRSIWARVSITLVDDGATQPYIIAVAEDITTSVNDSRALQESEERYRTLVDMSPDGILVISDHRVVYANTRAGSLFGVMSGQDLLDVESRRLIEPECFDALSNSVVTALETGLPTSLGHGYLRRLDGETIPSDLEIVVVPVAFQAKAATQIIVRDVTEEKQASDRLRHQATHDGLTGLPNRQLLIAAVEEILDAEPLVPFTILLMDLDRFKDVNDTFGHHYGDLLLAELGLRLQGFFVDSNSLVARLGGDEFAVLLYEANLETAHGVAHQLLETVERQFVVESQALDIGGSIGVVAAPDHGLGANELMRRADVAMYLAKRDRKGVAIYEPARDHHSPERLRLTSEFRAAIDSDQLVLHYQPKALVRTGELIGVEALVRWNHPDRGLIMPDQFIPLAEHGGLIIPMTTWVLHAAARQLRAWCDAGHCLGVAVNLSSRSLYDQGLVETVEEALGRWDVSPSGLQLELTETAIMDDPEVAMSILSRIHYMGVKISIDDFGTGYSSLSYLTKLPVDEIKIDRSFVADMADKRDDAFIVRSTVDLGHNLGLTVVAEGVEDQRTWDLLGVLGCDVAQGHYLGRPVVADDVGLELTHLNARRRA